MIKYHKTANGISIAEILPGSETIGTTDDLLDILADAGYNGSTGLIVHSATLSKDFLISEPVSPVRSFRSFPITG